ncbi:hypothetical protein MHYP_G00235810 [Metynnis hypsauchen]
MCFHSFYLFPNPCFTHYRLATFTNATRAALQGVKDELTALRLTTVQNRMALDLLLAKEGGVCAMVGDSCCTYIPANDEDHGAISVALDRMQRVSTQLQLDEHGGPLSFQMPHGTGVCLGLLSQPATIGIRCDVGYAPHWVATMIPFQLECLFLLTL